MGDREGNWPSGQFQFGSYHIGIELGSKDFKEESNREIYLSTQLNTPSNVTVRHLNGNILAGGTCKQGFALANTRLGGIAAVKDSRHMVDGMI